MICCQQTFAEYSFPADLGSMPIPIPPSALRFCVLKSMNAFDPTTLMLILEMNVAFFKKCFYLLVEGKQTRCQKVTHNLKFFHTKLLVLQKKMQKINFIATFCAGHAKSPFCLNQKKGLHPSYSFLLTNITDITCYKIPQNVSDNENHCSAVHPRKDPTHVPTVPLLSSNPCLKLHALQKHTSCC